MGKSNIKVFFSKPPTLSPIFVKLIGALSVMGTLSFCVGVFFLIRILTTRTLSEYFSKRVIGYFKTSGVFITLSGVINFSIGITCLILSINQVAYLNPQTPKTLSVLSIIIGVFFIILSLVLKKAQKLKLENDLTI
ncbi:DUF2975 domain-containing protein [Pseudotenacibaculum haliotis]|uniref:DUF2975 domain-containing protein n=1 Tax=Pseudotenacibaculum haliotis TaxID=1862138 RepID=A0ABW5LSF5_9FLAO